MDNASGNRKYLVFDGAIIGKLKVLSKITDLINHELLDQTPKSYIMHGSLWECHCECGKKVLVSEFSLSRGRNKSCGCLRRSSAGMSWEEKTKKTDLKIRKVEINARIKVLATALAHAKLAPVYIRDAALINKLGNELRSCYAIKAGITKQSNKPRVELTPLQIELRRKDWLKKNLGIG